MANYVDIDKTRQDKVKMSLTSQQQVVVMDFEKQHDKTDFRSVVVGGYFSHGREGYDFLQIYYRTNHTYHGRVL